MHPKSSFDDRNLKQPEAEGTSEKSTFDMFKIAAAKPHIYHPPLIPYTLNPKRFSGIRDPVYKLVAGTRRVLQSEEGRGKEEG